MSNEEFLTTKIFVEYYNKLVIELNKIIKRVEKLEKSTKTENNTSLNNDSISNQTQNTSQKQNHDENSYLQNSKKTNKKTTNLKHKKPLTSKERKISNDENNESDESVTNIYKKEKETNYKIMNSNNKESIHDSNCSEYFAQINPARLIECNEFSFKNILEMQKKQINLQNQKTSISSQKLNNSKINSNSKEIKRKKIKNKTLQNFPVTNLKLNTSKINSDIIKTNDEINLLLSNIIPNFNKNSKNKESKFNLLYKATKNGDSVNIFHELCDNQKDIIVVIETKKGCRFGGYTKIGFDSEEKSKKDDFAFLFSFDKMKIYKIKKGYKAIACYSGSGPCFFGTKSDSIHIEDNFFEKYSRTDKKNTVYEKMDEDYELNKGEASFLIKELEIFKINVE